MSDRPKYCYDLDTLPKGAPCPLCGATEEGDDAVTGTCQAVRPYPRPEPYIQLYVYQKDTPS